MGCCAVCGKPLMAGKWQGRRKFCSSRCRQKAHRLKNEPLERLFQYLPASLHAEIVMETLKEVGITEQQLWEAKRRTLERIKLERGKTWTGVKKGRKRYVSWSTMGLYPKKPPVLTRADEFYWLWRADPRLRKMKLSTILGSNPKKSGSVLIWPLKSLFL